MEAIKKLARERMNGACRACPICNGVACAGEVPGMGGTGTGESFKTNVEDLKKIKLNLRTLHSAKDPDPYFNFLDRDLTFPAIAAPITGCQYNMGNGITEEDYIRAVVRGSIKSGVIAMVGDGADPELYPMGCRILKEDLPGNGIGIIKPRANEEVENFIRLAEENQLFAVGMDVDGAGLITMALKGAPVGPKTLEELQALIKSTKLPFIVKGVMTPDEAILAVKAGADAIVVSNHGGRVLDHTRSTASVLPSIAKAIKGETTILVDSGIRSGVDIFKMLALGADAVLIGRPLIIGAVGGGADGVHQVFEQMKKELYQTMILTGAKDLKSIDSSMIYIEE